MKQLAHGFLLLVGLGAAFLRWVDLVNFTDLETGFVTAGSVWWRYGALAFLVLLAFLASLMTSRRPKALEAGGAVSGVILFVLAGLVAMQNAASIFVSLQLEVLLAGESGASAWFASLELATVGIDCLGLVTAVWLFTLAFSMFQTTYRLPAGGIALAILGNFYFYAILIQRFAANQSSFYRIDPTLSVFAGAAMLWFATVLLRAIYYPECAVGRKLYFAGMSCFYLCT